MKRSKRKLHIVSTLVVVFLMVCQVNAAIVSVSGPNSSAGTAPAIIPVPSDALNSTAFNSGMEGFDEAQWFVTTAAHGIDGGGVIAAGMRVSSHMIFLNKQDGVGGGVLTHSDVVWTFDGPVLGVMSDSSGNLEAASTFELGAPGTNYTVGAASQVAPFPARGIEGADSYSVAGNTITVSMLVGQPGDWIRVITLSPNRLPNCSNALPSVATLWPPNHKFVPITLTGVTDPDGDPITITIDSVFQDEPVDAKGSGNTTPDGQGVGTDTAEVRAERSGTKKVPGNGRVYHIGFTADDGNGGTCSGTVKVCVPHDKSSGECVDDGPLYDSTGP